MKTVLAFGDSVTWGASPFDDTRHPKAVRWPEVVAAGLKGVDMITEGLRGRTTVHARNSASAEMRGDVVLPALLHSHAPLDLVVIMLGLNDLYEGVPNYAIRNGLERLVEIVKTHPYRVPDYLAPPVLLVAPPVVSTGDNPDVSKDMLRQSTDLAAFVEVAAAISGASFYDASQVVRASALDGFHLTAEDTVRLGEALRAPVAAALI